MEILYPISNATEAWCSAPFSEIADAWPFWYAKVQQNVTYCAIQRFEIVVCKSAAKGNVFVQSSDVELCRRLAALQ